MLNDVGGLRVNNNPITDDLNNYIQTGTYILNGNLIENLPSDVSIPYGTLFVIGNWMNVRQMLMLNNDTFIYVRNYRVNSKSWSSWRKI